MTKATRLFGVVGICIAAAFAGCAVQQPNPETERPVSAAPGDNVVYRPKSQPGQTMKTAAQILMDELKNPPFGSKSFIMDPAYPNTWIVIEGCTPYPGRITTATNYIVHNQKVAPTIYLYQLFQPTLAVENNYEKTNVYRIPYHIRLANSFRLGFESLSTAQKVADALSFVQQYLWTIEEQRKEKLALFEQKAAEYRALKNKPPMSEEMRRLVVQANAMSQQKNYAGAIEEYSKAIELDPTSYPAAYFNLALLLAQDKKPVSAIYYMKHYLMLVPEAPDARGAQDKIYEWEFMLR
jgi:tetratricopeptide (TPR) repeat protein